MGRTRRKNLLKERVDRFLFHVHGIPPVYCDDFRHADRRSWDTDGLRVTKNGDPTPAEPLGDHDGRAVDLEAANLERMEVGPDPATWLDFAHQTGRFGIGALCSFNIDAGDRNDDIFTTSSGNGLVAGPYLLRESRDGVSLDNAARFFLMDGDGNTAAIDGSTGSLPTDQTNFAYSWGDGNRLHLGANGAEEGSVNYGFNTTTSIDTPAWIGDNPAVDENNIARNMDGAVQLVFAHPEWVTEQQFAYLDALLRDRTVDVPDLPVYGTRETGFKRRLPSHMESGTAGVPDYWWSSSRHYHHDPNNGDPAITQLPDFAGTNIATQRTGNEKVNAASSGGFGDPLDHIEFRGDDSYLIPTLEGTSDFQKGTMVFRGAPVINEDGARAMGIALFGDPNSRVTIRWYNDTINSVQCDLRDTNAKRVTAAIAPFPASIGEQFTTVASWDRDVDTVRLATFNESSGVQSDEIVDSYNIGTTQKVQIGANGYTVQHITADATDIRYYQNTFLTLAEMEQLAQDVEGMYA